MPPSLCEKYTCPSNICSPFYNFSPNSVKFWGKKIKIPISREAISDCWKSKHIGEGQGGGNFSWSKLTIRNIHSLVAISIKDWHRQRMRSPSSYVRAEQQSIPPHPSWGAGFLWQTADHKEASSRFHINFLGHYNVFHLTHTVLPHPSTME